MYLPSPIDTWRIRRPLQSVERAGCLLILPTRQACQPSQPSQARQASQPGQPGIEASGLQASMSAILLYRGSSPPLKAGTGRHRADSLLAPTAPGGAAKHATNPSNIDDMATFPTNRVMGRLWDDHFRDLGYPSKFYRVQDARFIHGSSI